MSSPEAVAPDLPTRKGRAHRRGGPRGRQPRRPSRRAVKDFYAAVLREAEREALEEARDLQGLDEEIALLRTKLQSALAEHPENLSLLLRGLELLVRAVSARYRISGKGEQDLYESVVGVLKGIGTVLMPEGESRGR